MCAALRGGYAAKLPGGLDQAAAQRVQCRRSTHRPQQRHCHQPARPAASRNWTVGPQASLVVQPAGGALPAGSLVLDVLSIEVSLYCWIELA
jgi:hypothetical protein